MELRKKSAAVLAGVAIAGLVGAAAASLGGLNTSSLGADDEIVAACHDATTMGQISVDFTSAYDTIHQQYEVSSVVFGNIDPNCNGKAFDWTLQGPSGVLDSGSGTVSGGAINDTVVDNVSAESVEHVHLLITG
jgi:hypothetical protein